MTMRFVMSDKLYQMDAWKAVFNAGNNRYGYGYIREAVFTRLLVLCAQNVRFINAAQFAQISMSPIKICEAIWSVCVEKNVLRQSDGYYSALSWMSENGLLISDNPANPQNTSMQEEKIKMADNVYLSRSEIRDLEQRYSGDEINKMCEYLSKYKKQSGRQYASDAAAMDRWVYKAIKDPNDMKYIDGMPDPVPDFIKKAFAKPIGR